MKPLLSVIIANYNNEAYIRESLDSVLKQNYKNLEIIIADDASTDDSPAIINAYEKKFPNRVKTIFSPINRGVAPTRHDAILRANGQYITTLDSDDYYYNPQKLEKEMELVYNFKKKTGKQVMAFSNIMVTKSDNTLIYISGDTETIKEGKILYDMITRSCMIPRDFIMERSAYFSVGGYDLSLRTHEDWDLKIKLAAKFEFHYTRQMGTAYRRHPDGLSSLPLSLRNKNLWKVFSGNLNLVPPQDRKMIKDKFTQFMKERETKHRNKNTSQTVI